MCGDHGLRLSEADHGVSDLGREAFPWDVGVFDAHCHPTDTMASMASVPRMKARGLTVMSTRSQDQELVFDEAMEKGLQSPETSSETTTILPSFGWHPWFSYQLYDDLASKPIYDDTPEGKVAHYDAILTPTPSSKDNSFNAGLPQPKPLSLFIEETRARLEKHPLALVGEIGLDKAFRLPQSWSSCGNEAKNDTGLTPGGREGRLLSPFRVQMAHQVQVLQAQLRLAGEMGRAVSVHGVQAHGILYETVAQCWKGHEKEVISKRQMRRIAEGAEDFSSSSEDEGETSTRGQTKSRKLIPPKPFPPRVCLHSFSAPADVVKQWTHPSVPADIFFSFSMAVNWGAGGTDKTQETIRAIPDDRILAESDLHIAGDGMDQALEEVARQICEIKGWGLREGVEKLGKNWRKFAFG